MRQDLTDYKEKEKIVERLNKFLFVIKDVYITVVWYCEGSEETR